MIVICEECGKKYRLDPSKIKGKGVKFKCKSCDHTITVFNQEAAPPAEVVSIFDSAVEEAVLPDSKEKSRTDAPDEELSALESKSTDDGKKLAFSKQAKSGSADMLRKSSGIGIRTKMFVLFLIIPISIITAASYLYLDRLTGLSASLIDKSTGLVKEISKTVIDDTARAIALQCGLYLDFHPDLTPELFDTDFTFKRLAQKKVGLTGYTFLFSSGDGSSPSTILVHPRPNIVGEPLSKIMKEELGGNYSTFESIVAPVETGQKLESAGFYLQKDLEGKLRQKYIAVTPIEETNLFVAATTYIDEFTLPVSNLEKDALRTTEKTRTFIIFILAGALVLIGLVVSFYSTSLSGRIRKLTDIANHISVGELDKEIPVKSGDEIGALADAIARMQDSIRLSIARLRKKR